jgi:hypothetical protein
MARKKFSNEQISQILVEAMFTSEQNTANKYGIAVRTINRWQEKALIDLELSKLIEIKKRMYYRRWVDKAGAALDHGIEYISRAMQTQTVTPEMLHAAAGALKIISEIITLREVLDARLSGQDRENNTQN